MNIYFWEAEEMNIACWETKMEARLGYAVMQYKLFIFHISSSTPPVGDNQS